MQCGAVVPTSALLLACIAIYPLLHLISESPLASTVIDPEPRPSCKLAAWHLSRSRHDRPACWRRWALHFRGAGPPSRDGLLDWSLALGPWPVLSVPPDASRRSQPT